jgi:L-alanine-DL-glutamate epimerase-like enolase superfamily enzyme
MAAVDGPWCEFPHDPPWVPEAWSGLVEETFTATDGKVTPPEEPGLGVTLNRDVLETH